MGVFGGARVVKRGVQICGMGSFSLPRVWPHPPPSSTSGVCGPQEGRPRAATSVYRSSLPLYKAKVSAESWPSSGSTPWFEAFPFTTSPPCQDEVFEAFWVYMKEQVWTTFPPCKFVEHAVIVNKREEGFGPLSPCNSSEGIICHICMYEWVAKSRPGPLDRYISMLWNLTVLMHFLSFNETDILDVRIV